MATIKIQLVEFRPVRVEYTVEASTIREALAKVDNGEAGDRKVISMPDMSDDPYEIDEQDFWRVDCGDGFELIEDIGSIELDRVT